MQDDSPTAPLDAAFDRIGLDPESVRHSTSLDALERLQRAHVTAVPFETLSITGDPYDDRPGEGVSLDGTVLFEKVIERRRGGFCYELNGLFGRLLADLGFDAERHAAMVLEADGTARPPANHLVHTVSLDRRYVVDVGVGIPTMRRPTPLDGEVVRDAVGVEWHVAESDRPDSDYVVRVRGSGDDDWTNRYVFRDVPRQPTYFEASCEYLATAPESPFTGDPVATIATERGHAKLTPGTLTRIEDGEEHERSVAEDEYHDVLESIFGVRYRPG